MKHNWIVTTILVIFFVLAQFTGLWLLNKDSTISTDINTSVSSISYTDTAIGARPEVSGSGSLIYVLIGISLGTILVLIIARYGRTNLWRLWFFLAVWMAITVSIGSIINNKLLYSTTIAVVIALALTAWKIFKPNIYVHNLTEILMYAGIGLIIVPLFDVKWSIVLLIIISIYDMYAVWKSKHMIKLAEFQSQSNMFAGLMVPYKQNEKSGKFEIMSGTLNSTPSAPLAPSKTSSLKHHSAKEVLNTKPKIRAGKTVPQNAILGGGDIVFPMIFIGAVMNGMIIKLYNLYPFIPLAAIKTAAFCQASVIIVTTTASLLFLFIYAEKGKFYPAMPFLSVGCFIGWLITLLL